MNYEAMESHTGLDRRLQLFPLVIALVALITIPFVLHSIGALDLDGVDSGLVPELSALVCGASLALSLSIYLLAGTIFPSRQHPGYVLATGAFLLAAGIDFAAIFMSAETRPILWTLTRSVEFAAPTAWFLMAASKREQQVRFARLVSIVFGVVTLVLILIQIAALKSALPSILFKNALIPRPFDLIPMVLVMAAALWSLPRLRSLQDIAFVDGVWACTIPTFSAILYVGLGGTVDGNATLIGLALIVLGRVVVLGGLLRDTRLGFRTAGSLSFDTQSAQVSAARLESQLKESRVELERRDLEVADAQCEMIKFAALAEACNELALIVQATGDIQFINKQGLNLLGLDTSKNLTLNKLVTNTNILDEAIRATMGSQHWKGNLVFERRDREPLEIACTMALIPQDGLERNAICLVGSDQTRAQELEEENRLLNWLVDIEPNYVMEVSTRGAVFYASPSVKNDFADVTEQNHPLLRNLDEICHRMDSDNLDRYTREILIQERYFRQTITYLRSEKRLILHSQDITEPKERLLSNELLVHRMLWLYELDHGNQKPYELINQALIESCSWFDLPQVTLSRQDENGYTYVYCHPETNSPGKPDQLPEPLRLALREHPDYPFEIEGDTGVGRPSLGIQIHINTMPWGVLYYSGQGGKAFDQHRHQLLEVLARWIGHQIEQVQNRDDNDYFFHVSKIMMCTCRMDGTFKSLNNAMLEKLESSQEDLGGRPFDNIVMDADKADVAAGWERLRTGHRIDELEFRTVDLGNQVIWLEWTAVPVVASGIAYCTLIDVTNSKQKQRRLQSARDKAVSTVQLKSDVLAKMTHEIRTPLNGVIGMLELLEGTSVDTRQTHYIDQMRGSAEMMLNLTNVIQDFSKLETSRLELKEAPLDLQDVAEQAISMLEPTADNKGISILMRYHPNANRYFLGDSLRLKQIIGNLLSNAVRFTNMGHVLVNFEISEPEGDSCTIKAHIKDTGIGISEEDLGQIFESFHQVGDETPQGTGLGLTISRQLARMMGGDITVSSIPGQGSCFTVELGLPVIPDIDRDTTTICELNIYRALILICDPLAMQVIEESLSDVSLEYQTCTSPVEALKAIEKAHKDGQPYRLIVADEQISNPSIDSFGKIIRSNQKNRQVKLIRCSLSSRKSEIPTDSSFDGSFTSPLTPSRITTELAQLFAPQLLEKPKRDVCEDTITFDEPISVLVAEDSEINQDVIKALLEPYNTNVTIVADGAQAVEMACKQKFDIIFMDCVLPKMDGFEATQAIRRVEQDKRHTPIVAMTAAVKHMDKAACAAAGMDSYLEKPIRKRRLNRILRELVLGGASETFLDATTETVVSVPIEIEKAARDIGVKKDLYVRILGMFASSLDDHLSVIDDAYNNRNGDQLTTAVHKLGGSAANLRIHALKKACLKIEELAQIDDWSSLEDALENLELHARKVVEESNYIQELAKSTTS